MLNLNSNVDFQQEYDAYVKSAKNILSNPNKILNNPDLEKKVRLFMVSVGLNTSGNFLNTLYRYFEKRILYMEQEYIIKDVV